MTGKRGTRSDAAGIENAGVFASVIIPVHDRPSELKRAVASVLAQTMQNFEILVIDDGSGPEVEKAVRAFADERIRYHRLATKSNANVARNAGLQLAVGKYAAMLDSDDEWLPRHLEEKIAFIERTECDGVFGSYCLDDGARRTERISRDFDPGEGMADYLFSRGRAATPTHVYRTECARETGWDEELQRHQDYDFSIRFARKFRFLPSQEITCVVHWKKDEKRIRHIDSQIRFMEKHGGSIQPLLRHRYLVDQYHQLKAEGAPSKYLKRYRGEIIRCIASMSYADYLSIRRYTGYRFARMAYKIHHAFLRFLVKMPGLS
jgi:glycosyltransferase involved in cell wall biosynthesis